MIYGEKYSFLSLFTKALQMDQLMDQWMDGWMVRHSYTDARTHLKSCNVHHCLKVSSGISHQSIDNKKCYF